jgi:hypothetical protein
VQPESIIEEKTVGVAGTSRSAWILKSILDLEFASRRSLYLNWNSRRGDVIGDSVLYHSLHWIAHFDRNERHASYGTGHWVHSCWRARRGLQNLTSGDLAGFSIQSNADLQSIHIASTTNSVPASATTICDLPRHNFKMRSFHGHSSGNWFVLGIPISTR